MTRWQGSYSFLWTLCYPLWAVPPWKLQNQLSSEKPESHTTTFVLWVVDSWNSNQTVKRSSKPGNHDLSQRLEGDLDQTEKLSPWYFGTRPQWQPSNHVLNRKLPTVQHVQESFLGGKKTITGKVVPFLSYLFGHTVTVRRCSKWKNGLNNFLMFEAFQMPNFLLLA